MQTCPSRELFERALESSSRALAGEPGLSISFSGQQESSDKLQLQVPMPDKGMTADRRAVLRGWCDMFAVKIRYHDAELHHLMSPPGPLSCAIYDELEALRVEVVASRAFSGVAANLAASFEHRCGLSGLNVLKTDVATPLANAAVLMVRTRLHDKPLPVMAARFAGCWQDEIDARSGDENRIELDRLARTSLGQSAFARWSRRFIKSLELVDEPEHDPQAKPEDVATESEKGEDEADQSGGEDRLDDSDGQETLDTGQACSLDDDQQESALGGDAYAEAGVSTSDNPFPQNKDRDPIAPAPDLMEGIPDVPDGAGQYPGVVPDYHAYTTRFDQVVQAGDLVDKDHGKRLRAELDQEISEHRQLVVRLANRLQNSLTTLQKRAWTFDLDDGLLDTTRLTRLVVDPTSPLAFKTERSREDLDTVVSFLIDNSGSMRGRPIALAAMFTDILAQTLERCHVATEILGFTTCEWRGGQTSRCWRSDGRPGNPGRLSDLRHVVYKEADDPWRRARQSLGVMLWPELLRENIDGEALLWAHQRLSGRSEQRRIMVVISDGSPADDATLSANGSDYLDAHLCRVVNWIETSSTVELLAVGIGHDVNSVYTRSVTVVDGEQLGDVMAHELIEILGNVPSVSRYPFANKL